FKLRLRLTWSKFFAESELLLRSGRWRAAWSRLAAPLAGFCRPPLLAAVHAAVSHPIFFGRTTLGTFLGLET
ncbi:hypothetical protein H5410_015947, partial [Solanum commersonii]